MAAGSLDAFLRQTELTEAMLHTHHQCKSDLDLLDYGCGWRGAQRLIFEGVKRDIDRLALFDPLCDIHPPREPQERIVTEEEILDPRGTLFDVIALSYVLCCVTPDEGRRILSTLHTAQPQAQLLVVDYTLQNRSQMEVLQLLTTREEWKWRQRMGDEDFATTRRRFTVDSLEQFVRSTGYQVQGHAAPLDAFAVRAAVVTLPQRTWMVRSASLSQATNVFPHPHVVQSS